jgi:2-amino-4-hydroxy-6-hydroxymethyldihydropteridine diphosphokinase
MAGKGRGRPVYLSLGSNLGDRRRYLMRAVGMITALPGVKNVRVSSIYETEPLGFRDQPMFLNVALAAEVNCQAGELLDLISTAEERLGRVRGIPGGPRTIDIDILLFASDVLEDERLTIPHPRMGERRFVLEPLLELEPGLTHPVTGGSLNLMLSER